MFATSRMSISCNIAGDRVRPLAMLLSEYAALYNFDLEKFTSEGRMGHKQNRLKLQRANNIGVGSCVCVTGNAENIFK